MSKTNKSNFKPMEEEELNEVMRIIRSAGLQAEWCDTMVGVCNNPVKCGIPTSMGDASLSDYIMIPKKLIEKNPMFVPVSGESMINAGYEEGDMLRLQVTCTAQDGDNVMVAIGDECTVKTLFHDEKGLTWLIPQNDSFDPILLDDEKEEVRILGIVVAVEKKSERVSYRTCAEKVKQAKRQLKSTRRLSDASVDDALVKIGERVKHARQWYAVYRAMIDLEVETPNNYGAFCSRVAGLIPEHAHLPVARELQRMAVQSFTRPVAMWSVENAPVSGVRYRDYLSIAQGMSQLLVDFADR